jgi:hypothetical protein
MDLTHVLRLRAWTPLSDIFPQAEPVMDGIWKIGAGIYLRTLKHDRDFLPDNPRAPFVTMGYWAPTKSGFERVVAGVPCERIDESPQTPPGEISLGTSGLYSDLMDIVKLADSRPAERAVYSNNGVFLYRSIKAGQFEFCFPSHQDVDEQTFAVAIRFSKGPAVGHLT